LKRSGREFPEGSFNLEKIQKTIESATGGK